MLCLRGITLQVTQDRMTQRFITFILFQCQSRVYKHAYSDSNSPTVESTAADFRCQQSSISSREHFLFERSLCTIIVTWLNTLKVTVKRCTTWLMLNKYVSGQDGGWGGGEWVWGGSGHGGGGKVLHIFEH